MRHGAVLLDTVLLAAMPRSANADLQVRLPHVDYQEIEIEHSGLVKFGPRGSSTDNAQNHTVSVGYGVLPWWKIELEGEMSAGGGRNLFWEATTLENTFALTKRGELFLDAALFVEYSHATGKAPNEIKIGPILYKELPPIGGVVTAHAINLFLTREVGADASRATGFRGYWQSVAKFHPLLAPGFEYYARIDDLARTETYNRQEHYLGPVLTGTHSFYPYGRLRYQVGYLFGLTSATPRGSIRWKLEYEFRF